jgi:sporulation protein YlmC with PRC-barrel domain
VDAFPRQDQGPFDGVTVRTGEVDVRAPLTSPRAARRPEDRRVRPHQLALFGRRNPYHSERVVGTKRREDTPVHTEVRVVHMLALHHPIQVKRQPPEVCSSHGTTLAVSRAERSAMLDYPSLRFIDASHVETGVTDLRGFEVLTSTGKKLGALDGLIVDPPERSIRYAVVDRGHRRRERLLVPLTVAQLDVDRKAIQVDLNGDEIASVEPDVFPEFSQTDTQSAILTARFRLPM